MPDGQHAPPAARRRLPWPDLGLVLIYGLLGPLLIYLAIGIVSTAALGHLLTAVAAAYALTSLAMMVETSVALPRRRAGHPAATSVASRARYSLTALVVAYLPTEQGVVVDTLQHLLSVLENWPKDDLQVILAYNTPLPLAVERELTELAASDSRLLVLHVEGSTSKADNINAALPYVTGKITALFDADHRPDPWSFQRALRWFDSGYDVVQGRCVIRNTDDSWMAAVVRAEFETIYAVAHSARSLMVDTALFGGTNGYWRSDVLRVLSMDPTMLTEDIDISVRAIVSGYRVVHDRTVISSELAPVTFINWFYQRLRWAQGWFQVTRKHTAALLHSPRLSFTQKMYWSYLLPWRELFSAISTQALLLLLAIIWIQATFGGTWHWDWFLTFSTILTLFSGGFLAAVAHHHRSYTTQQAHLAVAQGRRFDHRYARDDRLAVALFILTLPIFAFLRNLITWTAWFREWRGDREWVPTVRDADPQLSISNARG